MVRTRVVKQTVRDELLLALRSRFGKHVSRHPGVEWSRVQARLERTADKLWSLHEMERTGGQPDTVFVYHNGAESYYAARGFRARLTV